MFSQAETISLTLPQNFKHGILSTKLKFKFLFSTLLLFFLFIWAFPNSLKCGKYKHEHYLRNMTFFGTCKQAIFGAIPLTMHTRILSFLCLSWDQAVLALICFRSFNKSFLPFILDSISSPAEHKTSFCFLWRVIFLSQILFTQFERLDLIQEIKRILFPFS